VLYIAERQPVPNRRQPVPPVEKVKNTPAFRRSFADGNTSKNDPLSPI
jgi:hypothetical protein